MVKLTEQDKEEIKFEGLMRLVEGIVLQILDRISISGKWHNRDISIISLVKKKEVLDDMRVWFKGYKWDIWLNIYCEYHSRNSRTIKKNFKKIRLQSVRYVNARIKKKMLKTYVK